MSKHGTTGPRRPRADGADYDVGYGKPPKSGQFRPGKSGNPGGRPKGQRRASKADAHQIRPSSEPMKELILEEAYRNISVRDGEQLVEIPVIQAVLRSVALNAAKGQQRAQRMFTDLLQCVEGEKRAFYAEALQEAIKYKEEWEEEIKRCRKQGRPDPEPVPHPDNVIIDRNTGMVEIIGPILSEEKRYLDGLDELCADYTTKVEKLEAKKKAKPRDRKIARDLKETKQILDSLLERRAILRQRR
jgi:hypothetical protein